jgi:hypothetical protein
MSDTMKTRVLEGKNCVLRAWLGILLLGVTEGKKVVGRVRDNEGEGATELLS